MDGLLTIKDQIMDAIYAFNDLINSAQSTIDMIGTFAKVGIAAIVIIFVLLISVLARISQLEHKIDEIGEETHELYSYINNDD